MSDACDPDIWNEGNALVVLGEAPKTLVEELCKRMNDPPHLRVDWHYCGGRAVILYIGSLETARVAIEKQIDWFNEEVVRDFSERYPDWPHYNESHRRRALSMDMVTTSKTSKSIGQVWAGAKFN